MAGLGGVTPITVSFFAQTGVIAALRPGQVAQGIIVESEQNLLVRIGGVDVPIEPVAELVPGQRVNAELIQTSQGPQLRLTVLPSRNTQAAPAALPAAPASDLPALLTNVLETFGRLDAVRQAAHLLPEDLPRSESSVRLLLSLYFSRGTTGQDLLAIGSALSQAVAAGVLGDRDTSAVTAFIRLALAPPQGDLADAVQMAADRTGRPLEARLAAALQAGTVDAFLHDLDHDVAVQLERLRVNGDLAAYLRATGRHGDFEQAVDRVLNRLTAGQTQNLRPADMPFLFFEVPFDPRQGLQNAQVYFFGEGQAKGRRFNTRSVSIAIDLATTRMGDLWITLNTSGGGCACWIRATREEVVRAVAVESASLVARLEACGYRGAQVNAALWDGDRLQQAANLLRRFEGINLEA